MIDAKDFFDNEIGEAREIRMLQTIVKRNSNVILYSQDKSSSIDI